ncbi:MAG: hypothetical protein HON70_24075 [Lentisphaerae bacterium]|nr:hypothetical protein [Lentisphaerota bacterium]
MSPGRAYQLMRGVVAFEAIKVQFAKRKGRDAAMQEGLVPANEAQVRSLVPLLGNDTRKGKKAVCTVWKRVLGRTAAGEPLTAGLVAEEVSKWKRDHGEEPRASWDYEASPLGNLRPLEARIGKVTDVKALDSAVAQLRKLMQALERKREELASAPPK